MNPTRKRRLGFVLLALAAIIIAGTLMTLALRHNVRYLLTPTEVAAGKNADDQLFRLGGVVCEGSVRRTTGTLDVRFVVTDRVHQVPVRYTGILPDLFREGQGVIAEGTWRATVSAPTKCSPSTTKPTCRRKSPKPSRAARRFRTPLARLPHRDGAELTCFQKSANSR